VNSEAVISSNAWIGARPTPIELISILFIGINGVMIAGLQPILLGSLAEEGRVTAAQLGHAATAELLSMGLAAAFAGAKLPANQLRWIGCISSLLLALLDLATGNASGEMVTALRAAAGVPSGVLIWIAIAMITRSPTPERWSGIYLTLQTLAQFVWAAGLTAWVMPKYGADGGFASLAIICIATALASFLIPNRLEPLPRTESGSEMPPARGIAALTVAFLIMAFIVGVWVYAEPLSRQAGHPLSTAGTAVSLSLACQVLGGATATVFASRWRWFPTVLACCALQLVCVAGFAMLPGSATFLLLSGVFGFLWLFVLPFLVPMVIAADPTRRAALLIGGIELLGGSLGPIMASTVVTDTDVRGALAFGAVAVVLSVVVTVALRRLETRRSA
jgi:hypothetical protein